MKILYHITNLPPKIAGTEASLQELNSLRAQFGEHLIHLNPNQQSPLYLPRLLFGFHKLKEIRQYEKQTQLHHLYNADPFPFPIVRWWRQPAVYSISSGVHSNGINVSFFNSLAAVTVSDERSLEQLKQWGINNCYLVRPGLDISRFTPAPLPLHSDIRVMVGSAPWTKQQFRTKGVDALLKAAQQEPRLQLVFLWRGVLVEEIERRVQRMDLERQVSIINKKTNVNQVLANVHASIALATHPAIIRAYPHSLIESLIAGKPALISRSIPMADYIERHHCGQVVEAVTSEDILAALQNLTQSYKALQAATENLDPNDFSKQTLITTFQNIYAAALVD